MTPDDLQAVAGTRLHDCIAGHARHDSRAEAATAPGRCLSYGELVAEADACAMAMIAAGVGPGDRVATLAAPGLEFLVSFLASASVGALLVWLNPCLADPNTHQLIGHSATKLVLHAGPTDTPTSRP